MIRDAWPAVDNRAGWVFVRRSSDTTGDVTR